MKSEMDKSLLRAMQYYYIDGTFEITFGALCLVLGVFFFIQAALPESFISALLMMMLVLIIPIGALLKSQLMRRFKEKVTYPRTGYVSYRQRKGFTRKTRFAFALGVSAVFGAFVTVMVATNPRTFDWIPGFTSFFFALTLAWVGFRTNLPRFLILALLVFTTGILFSFVSFGDISHLSLFYSTAGLMMVLSGLLTLWKYLRDNPLSNEAQDGS